MFEHPAASILFFVRHLLALAGLTATAWVLGRLLTRRVSFDHAAEAIAVSTSLGLGTFSWLLFMLGLAGWLYPASVLGLALAIHLLGYKVWRGAVRSLRRGCPRAPGPPGGG